MNIPKAPVPPYFQPQPNHSLEEAREKPPEKPAKKPKGENPSPRGLDTCV
jgi:hypothetical protein